MRLRKILAALAMAAHVAGLGVAPAARAGSNLWTDFFPHPTRWRGYPVSCATGVRRSGVQRCSHLAPPLLVRKGGLLYRTTVRVVRLGQGRGYGLRLEVVVSVIDGQQHALHGILILSGAAHAMTLRAGGWGFGGGVSLPRKLPLIRPGQRRVSRTDYPSALRGSGVLPDYRLQLTVAVSGVVYYAPYRRRTPAVAVVVLRVPLKGPPTIRYKPPTP